MSEGKNLYRVVREKAFEYGIVKPPIPNYISENLKYDFFDWQLKAFENFLTFQSIKEKEGDSSQSHLMFNMATGTGKTLLMASMILYYYKQGYRHFVFFVNQNNIVSKTENNFINSFHSKYLFNKKIIIDEKIVPIKKVESFSDNFNGIEIKFTTIHKLYNDIHLEKENQTTLSDLNKKNIVMIADEAHHFNAETKKIQHESLLKELTAKTSRAEVEKKGWEHTVIELILNKNNNSNNNRNVLLEFTATIPNNEQVQKKYENKIIYKFGLKEFLSAGYTKEINLIPSTLEKKERILLSLLLNWYRHEIALKYDIPNFKSVILFRSKTIEESKADLKYFNEIIYSLNSKDFDFINKISDNISQSESVNEQGKSRIISSINFIKKNKVSYLEIINFIKNSFSKTNIIITNSETNKKKSEETTQEQNALLNNLEDKDNHIRGIFTVDRLTEGWDVLNLFDIVRLYTTQQSGGNTKKIPETTIKEKQLIGRGVRYFPFNCKGFIANKRKFDDDLNHELRVLEELYYHTFDEESRYISHLKEELKKDGYIRDDKIVKTFGIKKDFQKSDFFQKTNIWGNKQIDNPNRKKTTLKDLQDKLMVSYKINGLELVEEEMHFEVKDHEKLKLKQNELKTISVKIKEIENHIFNKAVNIKAKHNNSLFQFDKIKKELNIESIQDLKNENFLGNFKINIITERSQDYSQISNKDKLNATLKFLEVVFSELRKSIHPKIGSEFFPSSFKDVFGEPKTKIIQKDAESERLSNELRDKGWYILDSFCGTSEERELIDFISNKIGNLESKYNEVYLLRNEELFKMYSFEDGRGFQPDFILFLKNKKNKDLYYQVFIEPKGDNLLEHDKWKNDFLLEITKKYNDENMIKLEGKKYNLIGLPLFNKNSNNAFEKVYEDEISSN